MNDAIEFSPKKKASFLSYFQHYKHGLIAIAYLILYMIWFTHLEDFRTKDRIIIHMELDNYIPFSEIFIVPYFLWFFYVAAAVILLIFQNRNEYYRTCAFLFTGMTLFLIVSTLWPNGLTLRPAVMTRDNIFTQMVTFLHQIDTPTNVWPSIHVYNSIGAHLAILRSNYGVKRWVRITSFTLCTLIIMSTMFLKQHSISDVIAAFALAAIMYLIVYRPDYLIHREKSAEALS
jgi:membrane-associated phospholipid phosphatase